MPNKPKIIYPSPWTFRIIGDNETVIKKTVESLLPDKDSYDLQPGNVSKKGNYVSWHLNVVVLSAKQKDACQEFLLKQSGIHMIL